MLYEVTILLYLHNPLCSNMHITITISHVKIVVREMKTPKFKKVIIRYLSITKKIFDSSTYFTYRVKTSIDSN